MAKKAENHMLDIRAELGMDTTAKKHSSSLFILPVLLVVVLVICGICGIIIKEKKRLDYLDTYVENSGIVAVVEARYEGSHLRSYTYEVMSDDELASVHVQHEALEFVVLKNWYGNDIRPGKLVLEQEQTQIPQLLEGHTYLLFVRSTEEYLTDFYEIESDQDSIRRESPYYVDSVPLLEKRDTGTYLLQDGTEVSGWIVRQKLEQLIKKLTQG